MQSTLLRYYIYALINGLQFGWTSWLAFVVARGGNPGWAESAYHLAILLGEVPTGVLADMLGRRRSMIIGLLIGACSGFGYLLIDDTLTACLVMALSGLGGTFLSGADTALLYETAHGIGGAEYARRALARASAIQMAALAAAPLIAGWLYEQHQTAPFLSRAALSLLAVAVVRGMAERRAAPKEGAAGRDIWCHTRTALRYLRNHPPVLLMIGFSWAYNAVGAMTGQFGQVYFPAIGLSMVGAGIVFSLTRLVTSLTGWIAERLSRSTAMAWLRFAPLAQAALYVAMGWSRSWTGAAAFIVGDGLDGLISPTLNARINEAIPSEQRATILSFQGMGFSLLVSAAFPAAAYLEPVQLIYLATGWVAVAVALLWVRWCSPAAEGLPRPGDPPAPIRIP
ncbi:MAG: MFS transporter [Bacillota bacterium]